MRHPKTRHSPSSKKKSVSFGLVTEYPLRGKGPRKAIKSKRSTAKDSEPPLFLFCPNAPNSTNPSFIYNPLKPYSALIPTVLVPSSPSFPYSPHCNSVNSTASGNRKSACTATTKNSSHNPGPLITVIPRLESTAAFFTETGELKANIGTEAEVGTAPTIKEDAKAKIIKKKSKTSPSTRKNLKRTVTKGRKSETTPSFHFSIPRRIPTTAATDNNRNIGRTKHGGCVFGDTKIQDSIASPSGRSSTCKFCFLGNPGEWHFCTKKVRHKEKRTFCCKYCKRTFCREKLLLKHQSRTHLIESSNATKPSGIRIVKKRTVHRKAMRSLALKRGIVRADSAGILVVASSRVGLPKKLFENIVGNSKAITFDVRSRVGTHSYDNNVVSGRLKMVTTTMADNGPKSNPDASLGARMISGCRMTTGRNFKLNESFETEPENIGDKTENIQTFENIFDFPAIEQGIDSVPLLPTFEDVLKELSISPGPIVQQVTTAPNLQIAYSGIESSGDNYNNFIRQQNYELPCFESGTNSGNPATNYPIPTTNKEDMSSLHTLSSGELNTLDSLSCSFIDELISMELPTESGLPYEESYTTGAPSGSGDLYSNGEPFADVLKMNSEEFQTIFGDSAMYDLLPPDIDNSLNFDNSLSGDNALVAECLSLINLPNNSIESNSFNKNTVNTQPQYEMDQILPGNQCDPELLHLDINSYGMIQT